MQVSVQVSAAALLIGTAVDPTPERTTLTEWRLVQPVVVAHLGWRSAFAVATLNLEGLTIPDGELTAGMWGEGFVDRRHPHTYGHELVVGVTRRWSCSTGGTRCGAALVAGKGFVAFGSDDPMSRPIARFPVNHHWAQILERAMLTGQLQAGGILLEGSIFNGDEPERPGQWPRIARFGDSWSARGTLAPTRDVTASVSVARVVSPEHRQGAGPLQRKVHFGLRYRARDQRLYGLLEFARTSELEGFFVFRSFLAEGAWQPRRVRLYYRFERSERPEEERLTPFRAARPHLENSILGITRWTLHTFGVGGAIDPVARLAEVHPFVEGTFGQVVDVGPGLFRTLDQYGTRAVRSVSVGVRVGWRMAGHRMGEYGLAPANTISASHHGGSR